MCAVDMRIPGLLGDAQLPGRCMQHSDNLQVLIVDMLEGFTRIGPLASPRVDALVAPMAEFLREFTPRDLVVFACDAHAPDDVEFRRFPPHCIRGTVEATIRPELLAAVRHSGARTETVTKTSFSGFFRTNLDEIVSREPSDHWVVIGCVTDCCVEANVAELVVRGKRVTVLRDLVDTWDLSSDRASALGLPPSHIHAAEAINRAWFDHRLPAIWGAEVTTSRAFLAARR